MVPLDKTHACEVMAVFDTCHAGSNKPRLEAAFKKSEVKRLAAAFATDSKSTAKGADYRDPVDTKLDAWADLDKGKAPKTPTPDPNPADLGGEFSSGIIASLDKQIFAAIYAGALDLDAAKLNKLTKPDQLRLGPEGVCKNIYYLIQPPKVRPSRLRPSRRPNRPRRYRPYHMAVPISRSTS